MDLLRPIIKSWSWDFYLKRDGYDLTLFRRRYADSQYRPLEELRRMQLELLQHLVGYAHEHNHFYRKRFNECGFLPRDLKSLDDLKHLPVLTKDDIRNELGHVFSTGYDATNTVHKRTGGSTGVPLHIHVDKGAVRAKKAAVERHNSWAHFVPGCRVAAVWGDTDKKQPWKARLRGALTDRAFFLDTLKFDPSHISKFLANVQRQRPEVLMGHAHSLYRLAEFIRDNRVETFPFKGIITTAMSLSPSERATIQEVFASPVFDRYGAEELSIIASECDAHSGLHIFSEGLYVEILGSDESNPGEVVITDLLNHAMPLIRYQIGDYAVPATDACACGRTLPRLKEVSGRVADFLYKPDGTPVFGISILDTFVIHIVGFRQVQIIQDTYEHLQFLVVKDSSFTSSSMERLRENVAEVFGPEMTYDVSFVDAIPLTERGKYRFSICTIDREADK